MTIRFKYSLLYYYKADSVVGENGLSCSPGNVTKENIRKEKFIKIIFLYTYRQCNHHFFSFAPNYKIV